MKHTRDEVRTAYHEAGHAMIAMHYTRISSLGIERKVKFGGQNFAVLKGWIRFSRGSEVSVEENILIELAGPAAEKMCPAGAGRDFYQASQLDMEKIEKALKGILTDSERSEYIEKCMARAEGMVRDHWPEIKVLAKALLERRRVTGAQAEKIAAQVWQKERRNHRVPGRGREKRK